VKILEIRLTAYGPFTGTVIDLSRGEEGLHIVYGLNEAGKSSALRALRSLLYGIPERSPDGFLHPYPKMRVGAVIRGKGGELLKCLRRKGRMNTLRAEDDTGVLDETVLCRFLNGIDHDLFATMFGIGHEDLVRGGREIISGGGNVGQVLFAAGSGIANLREVQEQLQAEADALFKPGGQRPRINEAIGEFNLKGKALREAQLSEGEWQRHDRALREAMARKEIVVGELGAKEREVHRLRRISEALPLMAQRTELLEEFGQYGSAVLLSESFAEERRELMNRRRMAENDRRQALDKIMEMERAVEELEVPEGMLERGELIEALYQELGSQNKAAKDRVQLLTHMNMLRGEAKEILRSLREDLTIQEAEKLRLKKSDTVRITELGTRYERIVTRMESGREEISKLEQRAADLRNQLSGLPDPKPVDPLKEALEQAEDFGALEKRLRSEQEGIQTALEKLEIDLKKQTLWSGSLAALETVPVPLPETIEGFESRIETALRKTAHLTEDTKQIEAEMEEIEQQLDAIRREQEVPTEADLEKVRGLRDQGWHLIRAALEGQPAPEAAVGEFVAAFSGCENLPGAFETSMQRADTLADRLRREADRVARKAGLLANRDGRGKHLEKLKAELAASEEELSAQQREWIKVWEPSGIAPRSPKEMGTWARNHETLAARAAGIRERQAEARNLKQQMDAHLENLNRCLQSLSEPPARGDETLGGLIRRCRKVIARAEEMQRKRKQVFDEIAQGDRDLAAARARVERSERDLSQWQGQWEEAVKPLGLGVNAVPAEAGAVLEEFKALFDKLKEADSLEKRIGGIDRDADDFERRVGDLMVVLAGDLEDLPAEQSIVELHRRLNRVRTASSKRQDLEKQLKREKKREKEAGESLVEIESRLKSMCEEAGCEGYEELPEAERRSEKRRKMETELDRLNEQLRRLGAGAQVEDFIRDALSVDPDSIEGSVARLNEEIEELSGEKSHLDQTIGSERTELGKMDGSARAAELVEETQMLLGRIESDVEKYARVKLATVVLNMAMERYRSKHQGPILMRANRLFSQLTEGSFDGLRIEFNEGAQPVLAGVRKKGREVVGVEGMSDGTADQLYLALRLAGLEEYLEKNDPIPFIVDDILIKFDDGRAAAALQALAELSKKTQVIFFTHHRHLVDLAEKSVDPSVLIKHRL